MLNFNLALFQASPVLCFVFSMIHRSWREIFRHSSASVNANQRTKMGEALEQGYLQPSASTTILCTVIRHLHTCTVPTSKVGGPLKVAFFLLQNLENFSMDYLYCSYGSQCLLHCCSSGKSIVACQLCDTVSLVPRLFSRKGRVNVNKRRIWWIIRP